MSTVVWFSLVQRTGDDEDNITFLCLNRNILDLCSDESARGRRVRLSLQLCLTSTSKSHRKINKINKFSQCVSPTHLPDTTNYNLTLQRLDSEAILLFAILMDESVVGREEEQYDVK